MYSTLVVPVLTWLFSSCSLSSSLLLSLPSFHSFKKSSGNEELREELCVEKTSTGFDFFVVFAFFGRGARNGLSGTSSSSSKITSSSSIVGKFF